MTGEGVGNIICHEIRVSCVETLAELTKMMVGYGMMWSASGESCKRKQTDLLDLLGEVKGWIAFLLQVVHYGATPT